MQSITSRSEKSRPHVLPDNELQLRLKKGKHRGFRAEYADFMKVRAEAWPALYEASHHSIY